MNGGAYNGELDVVSFLSGRDAGRSRMLTLLCFDFFELGPAILS